MSKRSTELLPGRRALVPLALSLLAACTTAPERPEPDEVAEATRAAYARGLELMRSGQHEDAIAKFREVVERNDGLSGPYVNMGIAHRELGEPDKAREALARAIERDPASGAAHNQLGLLHRNAGRFEEARKVYTTGIDEHPEYARLYRNLGILCDIYLQDPSCALENFRAYRERTEGNDEKIKRWIADVERRVD